MEEKGRRYLRAWTTRVLEVPSILDVRARERSTRRESRAPEPRGAVEMWVQGRVPCHPSDGGAWEHLLARV